MKSKFLKSSLTIIAATFLLASCSVSKQSNSSNNLKGSHNAQNSLDWVGTYEGITSTSNGQIIELKINADETFSYITKSKSNTVNDTIMGVFIWNENTIILKKAGKKSKKLSFKVEENCLRELSGTQNSNATTNILNKTGNSAIEDKKWQIIEINGKTVHGTPESHYLIFHSKNNKVESKATCNIMINSYLITNQVKLSIKTGISTMMACPDDLESELINALEQADNISIGFETLTINKGRMAPLVKLKLIQ